jgi:hypothetical protein
MRSLQLLGTSHKYTAAEYDETAFLRTRAKALPQPAMRKSQSALPVLGYALIRGSAMYLLQVVCFSCSACSACSARLLLQQATFLPRGPTYRINNPQRKNAGHPAAPAGQYTRQYEQKNLDHKMSSAMAVLPQH